MLFPARPRLPALAPVVGSLKCTGTTTTIREINLCWTETVYPVMYEQANFVSRFVTDIDGVLLAKPSSSPEQKKRNTIGTTFDQQMFYENHHNTLTAAEILNRTDSRLELYKTQLPLLDPIQIGKSGQVKEFREEEYYGEIGDPHHRHTSMMLGLYPGQLINDKTPAWLDAAKCQSEDAYSQIPHWLGSRGADFHVGPSS